MSNSRILIVSPQQSVHEELSKILALEKGVYQISSCFQPESVQDQIKTSLDQNLPYSMAWVDVKINPYWNGIQVAETILKNDPNIELILWGEYLKDSMEEIFEILNYSHRCLFVRKPFDPMVVRTMAMTTRVRWNYDENQRLSGYLTHEKIEEINQLIFKTQKMAALGEATADIAHEINHPLGVIQMMSEQLQDALQNMTMNYDVIFQASEKIEEACQFATQFIKSLRLFARDHTNDKMKSFPIQFIIHETLSLFSEKFASRGIRIHFSEVGPDLQAECRLTQMMQVILNLLNNSVDALENLSEKWIRINIQDLNEIVEISVTDSGPGISPDLENQIFKRFFTTKPMLIGTGLGLSISKEIVEAHQGKIFLKTQSKNTCFVIQLPKKQKLMIN